MDELDIVRCSVNAYLPISSVSHWHPFKRGINYYLGFYDKGLPCNWYCFKCESENGFLQFTRGGDKTVFNIRYEFIAYFSMEENHG